MRIVAKCVEIGYRFALKPVLFSFDPERIHDLFLNIGELLGKSSMLKALTRFAFDYENDMLRQKICGLDFRNPVGLSEGFDKDGRLINILKDVGFGFMQVGSLTLNPYDGNPRPRLKRLKKSKSIWVNYGLKNIGVEKISERLLKRKDADFLLSASVAKTNCKATADKNCGIKDYIECFEYLNQAGAGDFYTINISCPNAFGGEPFTDAKSLDELLSKMFKNKKFVKPVFIKMPIAIEWAEFEALLDVVVKYPISGVIISNLLKDRSTIHLEDELSLNGGGLSGRLLFKKANEYIVRTFKSHGDRLKIIGVGGVFSAEDAYEMIGNGASLVQLITGMLFQGPQLIGNINEGLVKLMKRDGFKSISEAVGVKNSLE